MSIDPLTAFVTAMGILMSIGYYPQAYKIWKQRSARDVSLSTYSIFAVGTFVWTLYGVVRGDCAIILSFIIGVGGSWLVLGLILYYRRANRELADKRAHGTNANS